MAAWAQSSGKKTTKKSTAHSKTTSHKTASTPTKSHNPSSKTASTRKTSGKTTHSASKKGKGKVTQAGWRTRGQQNIDNGRAREIQAALIQQHYLDGEPTGSWDARSKAAMEKYQGDNGWQTKKIPDSRALIKLGLGPDHANLINPETAAIQRPEPGKGGSPQN